MSEPALRKFFFIHVMKTGGATFRQHLRNNFAPDELYPDSRLDTQSSMRHANTSLAYLLGLDPSRRERIRTYMGHFPFVATELLGIELTTFTMLRDPVERTLSYLKHCKRHHPEHHELALEQIYDDPFFRPAFIDNHQTKVFSMTAADKPASIMDVIAIDEDRLRLACANLEKVDVLGLNERYDEFVDALRTRFGWRFETVPNQRVSDDSWQASSELRQRIAADNGYDVRFYGFARELYLRRRAHAPNAADG